MEAKAESNMDSTIIGMLVLFLVFVIIPLKIKALRKAMGLLLVIIGTLASLTGIGLIIGVPMILVGGIFLFV